MPQYYNVLFLERAPSSAGDELLSKLLSAEKLIITEHPQNSLLHYSCSSAIIYSRAAAGVCMRIFYRMCSQQQSSCAFPQNPALSMTPGEENLCGMAVCNYKVTICQCRYSMAFFFHTFFLFWARCCGFMDTGYTNVDIWISFDGVLKAPDGGSSKTWSGDLDLEGFLVNLAKKWPMACQKPQLLTSVWDYSLSKHIPQLNGFSSTLFYMAWNTQS